MPYHTYDHKANTKIQKDPAIERWVYQRYFGQFGQFKLNGRSLKWLVVLYGIVPTALFFGNEKVTAWMDSFREEDINAVRLGRSSIAQLTELDRLKK